MSKLAQAIRSGEAGWDSQDHAFVSATSSRAPLTPFMTSVLYDELVARLSSRNGVVTIIGLAQHHMRG